MSEQAHDGQQMPPVQMTLAVPGRIAQDLAALVSEGVYLSPEEAIRSLLVIGWKFDAGSFHTLRLDLARDDASKTDLPEDNASDRDNSADKA